MANLKIFNYKLLPFYLGCILVIVLSADNFFFWDTIQLGAKHAIFFYESNFTELLLPDKFDSGHIPVFGMYLGLCWKIFGKSLMVSHWIMLPFLFGIVYQAYRLLYRYISQKYLYLALLIFLSDATLLAQSVLVSSDIPLVFCFLLGLNGVLSNKRWVIILAAILLSLISMRGMMIVFALGIIDLLLSFNFDDFGKSIVESCKKALAYLPAVFLIVAFNYIHFKHKGWFAYHEDSPWANSFVMVDWKGVIYNIGLLGWRFMDFGRVFMVAVGLVTIGIYFKSILKEPKLKSLVLIFTLVLASLSVSFVLYKHLSGHRYLLPAYLSFSVLVLYLVYEKLRSRKLKNILSVVLLLGLLTGNLWVYPPNIAQGWDASLAHLPYYKLRKEFLSFVEDENIAIENIGCTFPNDSEFKYMDLNDSPAKHTSLDLDNNPFVLYSNIYNDFSNADVERLESGKEFALLKEFKKGGVFLKLYKRTH